MAQILLTPIEEFKRVRASSVDRYEKLTLLADMNRINTLAIVKRAGSGHLGSSFSAMDIITWLYHEEMNTVSVGPDSLDRDIYFSSKGHDVPGLYSLLYSFGILPEEKLLMLRRLGGLDGHPEVDIPGIEANSGSLGMGISKGRGMAWAKRFKGNKGTVFVLTGDGELQEGQIYESMQTAAHHKVDNLIAIVDHNKIQTDKPVNEIIELLDLEAKFRSFGWEVARCDGHDFRQLESKLAQLKVVKGKPKILIADTIKGRGVSFMEPPQALVDGSGLYRWHAGAPDDETYTRAVEEITARLTKRFTELGLGALGLKDVTPEAKGGSGVSQEYVADAYGDALVELGASRKDLVVLDGDLAADCRVRKFEKMFPDRFIENGIAEQDMVSVAGGLALQGLLPVVNTFAGFLAARPNEHIYTNSCEKTKIIYALHYAGLIPAGPGKSHQSIRDISLFGALPNCTIIQPCNGAETRMALEYCVNTAKENCALRLVISPSPRIIELPTGYSFTFGQGVALTEGDDAVLFAYGPVMLHEALMASEILRGRGFGLMVVNMPWLNRFDLDWLADAVRPFKKIFVVEDHAPVGGLGDRLLSTLVHSDLLGDRKFKVFAVEGLAACGTPLEALCYHKLDGSSLADALMQGASVPVSAGYAGVYTADAPQ